MDEVRALHFRHQIRFCILVIDFFACVKPNKLLETIMIFDTLERKRFRNVIKNKKRSSLLSLYELCLSRIEKDLPLPAKEEVFTYLFEEPYSKQNDFLLRNEYRLLTDEAEAFLRQNAVEQYFPGVVEAARLKRIFESGNTSLFKKELDAMNTKWGNDLHYRFAVDPVYLAYFIGSEAVTAEHFAGVKPVIDEIRDRLSRFYNRQLTDYEVRKAYSDKVYSLLAETPLETVPSAAVPTVKHDDLVAYRQLKAKAYYKSDKEKVDILLEADKILLGGKVPELDIDEHWWLQATIGLEYYLQYDFKNAVRYLEALFASPGIESFNRFAESALNYMSALMSNGDFEKAVSVISPFEDRMLAAKPVFYKYICMKAFALLFMHRAPAARKELNRVENTIADFEFVYWRVALLLSFAIESRWEEAHNEFRNLLKTKTVKQNTRADLKNMVFILDGLLKCGVAHESGKPLPAAVWQQCSKKVEEMVKNPGDFLHPPRLVGRLLDRLKADAKK